MRNYTFFKDISLEAKFPKFRMGLRDRTETQTALQEVIRKHVEVREHVVTKPRRQKKKRKITIHVVVFIAFITNCKL